MIDDRELLPVLEKRSVVVKRLKPLLLEAVVRGYLIGSGWKDYRASGAVCGIELPAGLRQADRLPDVIFTPSNKAGPGEHDINIDFQTIVDLVGLKRAEQVRQASIQVYEFAVQLAAQPPAVGEGIEAAEREEAVPAGVVVIVEGRAAAEGAPLGILAFGGWLAIRGETTLGVLLAVVSGFERISGPIRDLIGFYREAAQAGVQHRLIADWMLRLQSGAPDRDAA